MARRSRPPGGAYAGHLAADAHPSIEVTSRDSGTSFAEGASRGAPHARQAADRFHETKNLVEAVQQVLGHEHAARRAAAEAVTAAPQQQARQTAQPRRRAC